MFALSICICISFPALLQHNALWLLSNFRLHRDVAFSLLSCSALSFAHSLVVMFVFALFLTYSLLGMFATLDVSYYVVMIRADRLRSSWHTFFITLALSTVLVT